MLPDMSDTLDEWSDEYTVKNIDQRTVDFESSNVVTSRTIQAIVQVADKDKLNTDQIDWSLRYLLIHSSDVVENGELIEYNGEDYKIIDNGDWQAYGFTEAVAEQTKQPLVEVA